MIVYGLSVAKVCAHVSFKNAKKWDKKRGLKKWKERRKAVPVASGFALLRLHAPVLTFTVFRLIKLLLSAVLNSIFSIPDHYFPLFLLVSIHPSPLLFLPPSLPPSLSRALSFAESYWSRRRLISPSLRACVMKHMRTELITAIFCRKLISRNKDPKSFFFSIIRSHFHLFLAPSNTRLIACFASKLFLYCL